MKRQKVWKKDFRDGLRCCDKLRYEEKKTKRIRLKRQRDVEKITREYTKLQ